MSKVITSQQSRLLFLALLLNGVFSSVSGLVMVSAPAALAGLIGVTQPFWLRVLGIGLLGFGSMLLWHAYRQRIRRFEAILISALDMAWVAVSAVVLIFVPEVLTGAGIALIGLVGLVVMTFGDLQLLALWRMRFASSQPARSGPH